MPAQQLTLEPMPAPARLVAGDRYLDRAGQMPDAD